MAHNQSTRNSLLCSASTFHGFSKSPHCSSHISPMLSVLKRNYLRQKEEGLSNWDANLLFLLSIEVSGWSGKEKGIHFPIIWSTWWREVCVELCWIPSLIIEGRVKKLSKTIYLILKDIKITSSVKEIWILNCFLFF